MTFEPYPSRSGYIFLVIGLFFGAVVVFVAGLMPQQSGLPGIFKMVVGLLLALGAMGLALYGAVIVFKLRYHLNRNGMAIQWGLGRQLIPFEAIENFIPGERLPSLEFRGLNLAGFRLGRAELTGYGPVKIHTTAPPAESLLVVTARQAYLISPRQPDRFIRAWQARRGLGPTQMWTPGLRRSWPLNVPLLADPLTWWLWGLAALACLALFGYISFIFPNLPPSLPIHFNTFGRADRIADKITLLMLPAAGAGVLLFNGLLGSLLYRWEKVGAYLLWGSAIVLQLCLWVAVLTITATGR